MHCTKLKVSVMHNYRPAIVKCLWKKLCELHYFLHENSMKNYIIRE